MKLLLDTHVMLWWLRGDPRLGARMREAIANPRAQTMVSIASFWELSIKARIGKLAEAGSLLIDEAREQGLTLLAVSARHLAMLERLERVPGHNDPFDHLIIAQARAERAILMTADGRLGAYEASGLRIMQ